MTYEEARALATPLVRLCDGDLGRIVGFHEGDQSVEVRRLDGRSFLIPVSALTHGLWCAVEMPSDQNASSS